MCPILSSKGHRQSGGHWNAALRLLGTNIGLAGFFGGWWCVGGRGALSGSGVRGVNGSLVVMSKYSPKNEDMAQQGRCAIRGTNDRGSRSSSTFLLVGDNLQPRISGEWSELHTA